MNKERLKLITACAIFGTIGLVRRYIPYPSALIALVRAVVGTLFLLILLKCKHERIRKDRIRKNAVPLLISGVLLGANWICLFEAYRFTTVSAATISYYMAPVIVVLLAPVLFREKLGLKRILCAAAAFAGMIAVSGVAQSGLSGLKGILFGLAAAAMYASIMILNKRINGLTSFERTIAQLAVAAISMAPYVLLTCDPGALQFDISAVSLLVIAGIVHTGIAYALYFDSMHALPAHTVALCSYIDPVLSVLLSALVLKEAMTLPVLIGACVVLLSAYISEKQ